MIIYLPFLCCQPSSAITTIVINEGSIYQPASPRFLFLPLVSTALLLYLTPVQFTLFLHLFLPPPSIHPIHPSIPHSHSARSRLFVSAGEGWDAACHPREADSHPGCWRWPGCCQSICRKEAEGVGVDMWCGSLLFRNSLFFFFLLPDLHSQSFILASNMNKSTIVTLWI